MKKKILIIDDFRSEKEIGLMYPTFDVSNAEPLESVLIARTYTLGINALRFMGPWDTLYLDHDFGDPIGKTGYHVLCQIEEWAYDYKFDLIPKNLICVSSNASGIEKINKGWASVQARLPQLMEEYLQMYKESIKRGFE